MPRPRKDGKPTEHAVRLGKERTTATGRKWRVRAYAPTPTNKYGKITYVKPGTDTLTSGVPTVDETLDQVFEQVESWLDLGVAMGCATDVDGQTGRRDIRALGPLYLTHLTVNERDEAYIAGRRCILNKWIYPVLGSVLVADWSLEHSAEVIRNAKGKVSARRLQDIGSVLSGLRATAHRRRPGGRWLRIRAASSPGLSAAGGRRCGRARAWPVPWSGRTDALTLPQRAAGRYDPM